MCSVHSKPLPVFRLFAHQISRSIKRSTAEVRSHSFSQLVYILMSSVTSCSLILLVTQFIFWIKTVSFCLNYPYINTNFVPVVCVWMTRTISMWEDVSQPQWQCTSIYSDLKKSILYTCMWIYILFIKLKSN